MGRRTQKLHQTQKIAENSKFLDVFHIVLLSIKSRLILQNSKNLRNLTYAIQCKKYTRTCTHEDTLSTHTAHARTPTQTFMLQTINISMISYNFVVVKPSMQYFIKILLVYAIKMRFDILYGPLTLYRVSSCIQPNIVDKRFIRNLQPVPVCLTV